jgi:2-polyprenyl-3-methyl-5-hydroxy-6-metoxy-1,4-benzoquinol methylase
LALALALAEHGQRSSSHTRGKLVRSAVVGIRLKSAVRSLRENRGPLPHDVMAALITSMTPADRSRKLAQLLDEQVAYYRALAAEYEDHTLALAGGDELTAALDAFRPTGSVLELACGPGTWTGQLLRHATEVTAVDASHEMLAIASARHSSDRVRFI